MLLLNDKKMSKKKIRYRLGEINDTLKYLGFHEYKLKYSIKRKAVYFTVSYKIDIPYFQKQFYLDKSNAKKLIKSEFAFNFSKYKLNGFANKINDKLERNKIFTLKKGDIIRNKKKHYYFIDLYFDTNLIDIIDKTVNEMANEIILIKNICDKEFRIF